MLDYLSAASICAMHLSRLGAEIVLWSSEEFGFLELGDSFTSGSSLMPQKKNPDAAELLRAKAPRVAAHFNALLGVMHALPLAYNKDMQEDKEHLFDTVDTLNLCLDAATGMLRSATFDRERLAGAAADEFLAATDVADLLVRRGVPFRESHAIVAGLVRHALEQGKQLSELTSEELRELLGQARRRVLRGARAMARGWSRRCPRAARPRRGCGSSSTAPAQSWREFSRAMPKREARMVSLGYGKFVKADRDVRARADRSGRQGRRPPHLRARRGLTSRSWPRAPSAPSSPTSRPRSRRRPASPAPPPRGAKEQENLF